MASAAVITALVPASTSALASQFRKQDSEIPKSLANCPIGASPWRATSTTLSRNSFG